MSGFDIPSLHVSTRHRRRPSRGFTLWIVSALTWEEWRRGRYRLSLQEQSKSLPRTVSQPHMAHRHIDRGVDFLTPTWPRYKIYLKGRPRRTALHSICQKMRKYLVKVNTGEWEVLVRGWVVGVLVVGGSVGLSWWWERRNHEKEEGLGMAPRPRCLVSLFGAGTRGVDSVPTFVPRPLCTGRILEHVPRQVNIGSECSAGGIWSPSRCRWVLLIARSGESGWPYASSGI